MRARYVRPVDLLDLRKLIVVAIASDDELVERLVLKGGNALEIVHKIGQRASLDIDFSMADDVEDVAKFRHRLFAALRDRFDSAGLVVFDEKLEPRPRERPGTGPDRNAQGFAVWGGYYAAFKLIPKERYRALGGAPGVHPAGAVLEAMRREAQVSGPGFLRVFEIEISKFEYTVGRVAAEVDDYRVYVYTPAMIAAEKLRAICQQMPAYAHRAKRAPRPRDFYDIHAVATDASCDLAAAAHHALVRNMFAAKEVPLDLVGRIGDDDVRAFHAQEWPAVVATVRGRVESFAFYADFVATEGCRLLAALGDV